MKGYDTMKFKMAIAAAALALLGATSAHAQLSITLDTPVQTTTVPSFVTFSGLIQNIGAFPITITGDGVGGIPAGVIPDLPQSDLVIGNFPITLGPNDTFYGDWLFGLDIPASQTTSFGGTYAVFGEDANGAPLDPFTADFRVNIQVPGVPEPGAMALLVSGLIGGSLFLVRRRK
jgi:hypothetical protein